eukprot:sb/3477414/
MNRLQVMLAWILMFPSRDNCYGVSLVIYLAFILLEYDHQFCSPVLFTKPCSTCTVGPRFTGTPTCRAEPFPPSIPVNWGPTVLLIEGELDRHGYDVFKLFNTTLNKLI